MNFQGRVLLVFLSLLWSACQVAPTKVYETSQNPIEYLKQNAQQPIRIDANTVVLDARPRFDYLSAHIPESQSLEWNVLTNPKSDWVGELDEAEALARRLALMGVNPQSQVVVVGGKGPEAGRVAWSLYYLGVEKINIASIDYFKTKLTNVESFPAKNAPYWKPEVRTLALAKKSEVKYAIANPGQVLTFKNGQKIKVHIIDVRSPKEFFNLQGPFVQNPIPNIGAINIQWTEFFDDLGRVSSKVEENLQSVGVSKNDRIIVISNQGLRSAAVTMALLSMGFSRAGNYAGGYSELMNQSLRGSN